MMSAVQLISWMLDLKFNEKSMMYLKMWLPITAGPAVARITPTCKISTFTPLF